MTEIKSRERLKSEYEIQMRKTDAAEAEIERLNAERAGDQQRLFHYEGKIEELSGEIERLRAALRELRDEYPKFRMLDIIDAALGENVSSRRRK
jgi:chromosome segregation ATPase